MANKMKIGVMGGTFDPIHHGHLVAAAQVQDYYQLEQVIFVPTATQPFKVGRESTQAEHRYLMASIATASNPKFHVSRVDIDRGGTTYTVDTLNDLQRLYPQAELYFITGADSLASLPKWHEYERLLQMARFVGVTRPGHELSLGELSKDRVFLHEVTAMAISSTEIRNRVRDKQPIWYLVPDGVVQYIVKNRLYNA